MSNGNSQFPRARGKMKYLSVKVWGRRRCGAFVPVSMDRTSIDTTMIFASAPWLQRSVDLDTCICVGDTAGLWEYTLSGMAPMKFKG